jgi:hypothetical protein
MCCCLVYPVKLQRDSGKSTSQLLKHRHVAFLLPPGRTERSNLLLSICIIPVAQAFLWEKNRVMAALQQLMRGQQT